MLSSRSPENLLNSKTYMATCFLIIALQGCGTVLPSKPYPGYALFEEKCKTAAGEKIYRSVENVEGVLLVNLRTRATKDEETVNYPGAALANEAKDNEYIETFLSYEHSSGGPGGKVTPQFRGFVNRAYLPRSHVNIAGYQFVDAIDPEDGIRYRYTFVEKPILGSAIGMIDNVLVKTPTKEPMPRYGIYFEDHVIPAERASGIASTTIRVMDLVTNELLGEFNAFAYGGVVDVRIIGQRLNWNAAAKCPQQSGDGSARTRQFADQVLIPRRGD